MGIAEDVVVRVDGFTFLADFVVVNFELDPIVPIILGRHFLRTAKALIDLHEEKLTLRIGKEELVYYADNSEKNKNKQFAHAISIIDFSKDESFSGSTTIHSDTLLPSSSPVKTSNYLLEEFADELALLDVIPQGNEDVDLEAVHEDLIQKMFYPTSGNPTQDTKLEIKSSSFPILTSFEESDSFWEEIKAFLAIEIGPISPEIDDSYYDEEGDIHFLEDLLIEEPLSPLPPPFVPLSGNPTSSPSLSAIETKDPFNFNDDIKQTKDSKKDLIGKFDLPPSLLDFYSLLLEVFSEIATLTSFSFGNEDKVFNPGILSLGKIKIFDDNSTRELNVQVINVLPTQPTLYPTTLFFDHGPQCFKDEPLLDKLESMDKDLNFLFSFGSEDTIFDPGIFAYIFHT
ncbi:reverse transcriptase domain-containing protein [Tanacetum coccineum]